MRRLSERIISSLVLARIPRVLSLVYIAVTAIANDYAIAACDTELSREFLVYLSCAADTAQRLSLALRTCEKP
jgi:hypothetical protein